MKIERLFTVAGKDPLDGVELSSRQSKMVDPDGSVVFQMNDIQDVPGQWSQTAVDVLSQKYFRKRGLPVGGLMINPDDGAYPVPRQFCPSIQARSDDPCTRGENSARQVFHRLAGCWTYHGWKAGLLTTEEDAQAYYDEMFYMLAMQMAAPNSPQWYNCGLHWAYGITGPSQGHWRVNPESKICEQTKNSYEYPQSSACFILSVHDNLCNPGGIMDTWVRESRIFKMGGGAGSNFSELRGKGEPLTSGGTSSGLMSWLAIGDEAAKSIKSAGSTRRAAKMDIADIDHPDIEDFINWKLKEESKVAALVMGSRLLHGHLEKIKMAALEGVDPGKNANLARVCKEALLAGVLPHRVRQALDAMKHGLDPLGLEISQLDTDWQHEAYLTVSGQNSNNSVRISNEFMNAVKQDTDWNLYWRTELRRVEQANSQKCHPDGRVIMEGDTLENPRSCKTLKAKNLWGQITHAAWACADPGVQFDTTINDWNPTPKGGKIAATNPCCVDGSTLLRVRKMAPGVETITVGDLWLWFECGHIMPEVYCWDQKTNKSTWARIRRIWISGQTSNLVKVTTHQKLKIICTPEHRFLLVDGSWVEASSLIIGQELRTLTGARDFVASVVKETPSMDVSVFDLEVSQGNYNFAVCQNNYDPGIILHNSEFNYLDDTSCNLASLNLMGFYRPLFGRAPMSWMDSTSPGDFCWDAYRHAVRLWTLTLEITVGMSQYPSKEIAQKSYDYRPLGLGYCGLGSLLMVRGLAYDSDKGRSLAAALTSVLNAWSFAASAEMAGQIGPFTKYEENKKDFLRVVRNHARAADQQGGDYEGLHREPQRIAMDLLDENVLDALGHSNAAMIALGKEHGYRNGQLSNIAPTGTISLLMDAPTSGCEPDFALVKFKKLAGGGYFRLANSSVGEALARLGYSDQECLEILQYLVGTGRPEANACVGDYSLATEFGLLPAEIAAFYASCYGAFNLRLASVSLQPALARLGYKNSQPGMELEQFGLTAAEVDQADREIFGHMTVEGSMHLKQEHLSVFDCANRCGALGKRFIQAAGHIRMLGAIQPFLSGSASKTCNLPNEATVADVSELYWLAWELMVKSVALYRDGCKLSQPLSAVFDFGSASATPEKVAEKLATTLLRRKKLPGRRTGWTQKARIGNEGKSKLYLTTGEYPDGTLGEIFLTMHKEGAGFRAMVNALAISISIALQWGVPLEEFVDAFQHTRFEPHGVVEGSDRIKMCTSILDYFVRELGIAYLGRNDLANVQEEENPATTMGYGAVSVEKDSDTKQESDTPDFLSPEMVSLQSGYTGDPCSVCGHMTLKRSGSCVTCDTCAFNSGCAG